MDSGTFTGVGDEGGARNRCDDDVFVCSCPKQSNLYERLLRTINNAAFNVLKYKGFNDKKADKRVDHHSCKSPPKDDYVPRKGLYGYIPPERCESKLFIPTRYPDDEFISRVDRGEKHFNYMLFPRKPWMKREVPIETYDNFEDIVNFPDNDLKMGISRTRGPSLKQNQITDITISLASTQRFNNSKKKSSTRRRANKSLSKILSKDSTKDLRSTKASRNSSQASTKASNDSTKGSRLAKASRHSSKTSRHALSTKASKEFSKGSRYAPSKTPSKLSYRSQKTTR